VDAGGDTHALVGLVTYLIDLGLLSVVIELSVPITDEFILRQRRRIVYHILRRLSNSCFYLGEQSLTVPDNEEDDTISLTLCQPCHPMNSKL